MSALLEARGLTKWIRDPWTWRRTTILAGLDLAIEEGELFGLIGHNGAGKTTTFKLLLGFLRPSAGAVTFAGRPLGTARISRLTIAPPPPRGLCLARDSGVSSQRRDRPRGPAGHAYDAPRLHPIARPHGSERRLCGR